MFGSYLPSPQTSGLPIRGSFHCFSRSVKAVVRPHHHRRLRPIGDKILGGLHLAKVVVDRNAPGLLIHFKWIPLSALQSYLESGLFIHRCFSQDLKVHVVSLEYAFH